MDYKAIITFNFQSEKNRDFFVDNILLLFQAEKQAGQMIYAVPSTCRKEVEEIIDNLVHEIVLAEVLDVNDFVDLYSSVWSASIPHSSMRKTHFVKDQDSKEPALKKE